MSVILTHDVAAGNYTNLTIRTRDNIWVFFEYVTLTLPGNQYSSQSDTYISHKWKFIYWTKNGYVQQVILENGSYALASHGVGLEIYINIGSIYDLNKSLTVFWTTTDNLKFVFDMTEKVGKTYYVYYNGNENTGGSTENSTLEYGKAFNFQYNGFTKTGYTFSNWSVDAFNGAFIDFYNENQLYGVMDRTGSLRAYAQWTPAKYTIRIDNGSGTGTINNPSATYGSPFTFPSNTPLTKTGYTFSGWDLYKGNSREGTTTYNSEQAYGNWNIDGTDINIRAQWTLKTSTITYNGNQNTGGTMTTTSIFTYNSTFTFQNNGFTRTGYTFSGWWLYDGNNNRINDQTTYDGGVSYSNWTLTGTSYTAKAQWTGTEYTITYIPDLPPYLYSFTTHTFTNAGAIGRTGPILTDVRNAYRTASWAQNDLYFKMGTQGIQEWTVPVPGNYSIEVAGAAGGTSRYSGGKGALMKATFNLTEGKVLAILVGQKGAVKLTNSGGGGGTFVWDKSSTIQPLIVGGGGGGTCALSVSGTPGTDAPITMGGTGGIGGATAGSDGKGATPGGSGWITNGTSGYMNSNTVTKRPLEGGFGGLAATNQAGDGGFGGGASASAYSGFYGGGGGGGGYSGGAGPSANNTCSGGGGGGSYISDSGTNPTNTAGINTGDGFVTITFLSHTGYTYSNTATYNSPFTFLNNNFTKTGYEFIGWWLYEGSTRINDQITYSSGQVYGTWTLTETNYTAIAQWTATSTISYVANEGINTMTPSNVTYNTIFTFADNLFTRTGYSFNGWHLYDGDTNTRIDLYTYANQESSRWLITTNNIRAIAQWTTKEYTITYSANPVQVALYSFTTHTFTNAGAIGRTGPILSQVQSVYSTASWTQNTSYINMSASYQGIQEWTVPATGNYTIEVAGASGGGATAGTEWIGGKGARMKGTFYLTQGMVLSILVGQKGVKKLTTSNCNNGGGGGTFVWDKSSTTQPLIVGGGGGGSSFSNAYNGLDAPITQNGTGRFGNAYPGTNGNGANPGGSGWLSNGTFGFLNNNSNNTKPLDGGLGGAAGNNNAGDGGFGGGASGSGNLCTAGGPGGGGGYSGGAGPSGDETLYGSAGGGGSYNGADIQNQINTAGVNTGHGYVIIIFLSSPYKATYGINFTFQTNNFTKTGYGFSGWHLYEGTTRINPTSTYAGGHDMIWNIDKNLTAVAQWTQESIITYEGNGNTGGIQVNSSTATYGNNFTFNTNTFTLTGYEFSGWHLYDGTTRINPTSTYTSGGSYVTTWNIDKNLTAQAQWTLSEFTVTFNTNGKGGANGTGYTKEIKQNYNTIVTCPIVKAVGYVFGGWATSVISTIVDKAGNDIFTLGAANQSFFAIWAVNTNGIRFSELQSVFGGSHQISMSEYRTESGQTIANSEIRIGIHLKGKSRLS
jgi:uncharacterized repeat protein (TIGR02543 family)